MVAFLIPAQAGINTSYFEIPCSIFDIQILIPAFTHSLIEIHLTVYPVR